MAIRLILASLLLVCSSTAYAALPDPPDAFAGVRFLVGDWVGVSKPGEGSAAFSLQPDLQGKVLVRKHAAEVPTRADPKKLEHHEDVTILYPAAGLLRADYWDNEGHVIHYTVTTTADRAVFDSDPGPGPRFQLSYAKLPAGQLEIAFAIAMPGQELKPYLKGLAKRK